MMLRTVAGGVEPICEVLKVTSSTYYAAGDRPLSERAQRNAALILRLVEIWEATYSVYELMEVVAGRLAGPGSTWP
jgi:hypothetical protein